MRKFRIVLILLICLLLPVTAVMAVSNPYGDLGYGDCTWTAWQLTYERLGIALPRWGYADDWVDGAAADGYPTGSVPEANSIVVWAGHVGFVAQTSGNNIYVMEGGYDSSSNGYHEGWYDGTVGSVNWGMTLIGYVYLSNVPADTTPVAGTTTALESARRTQELAALQAQKASLQKEISETQTEIDTLNAELNQAEAELAERMRAMYMMGTDSYMEYLFTADNLQDFFTKADQISQLISSENAAIANVREKVKTLEDKQAELTAQQAELDAMTI